MVNISKQAIARRHYRAVCTAAPMAVVVLVVLALAPCPSRAARTCQWAASSMAMRCSSTLVHSRGSLADSASASGSR